MSCDDGNACTIDTCDRATGACSHPLRDTDHDGHVDSSCGGDDCDDANSSVWFAPVAVTNLHVLKTVPTSVAWDDQRGAVGPGTTYNAVSGKIKQAGFIEYTAASCLYSGGGASYFDQRVNPTPGFAYWYLVRSRNTCGVTTYGTQLADNEIPSCP
jgi:hypothetical protein